jgi:phosphoglycerate dehydrogenase-like enzyme
MTIAILGLGNIGRTIAALLSPWKPHIVGVSRTARQCAHVQESLTLAELPEVLGRSNAVFVALSLNAETDSLLDDRQLSRCKNGCFIVNVSRSSIIDHHALADALTKGTIGGAGLDVTHPEPLPPTHPLWSAPNVIVTPHIAGSSGALSSRRLAETAADNLKRFLAGQPLANVVS